MNKDFIYKLFYKDFTYDLPFDVQVDDVLETKLNKMFQLVMDKGTLDAIGLHPDGPIKRLVSNHGILFP